MYVGAAGRTGVEKLERIHGWEAAEVGNSLLEAGVAIQTVAVTISYCHCQQTARQMHVFQEPLRAMQAQSEQRNK
jgi:hypothetical protein